MRNLTVLLPLRSWGGCFARMLTAALLVISAATAQTWVQLLPTGSVTNTANGYGSVYDSANNRFITFGGGFIPRLNTTTVLQNANGLGGSPTWTQLSPTGPLPPIRAGHDAVYDGSTNRMIIFGGISGSGDGQPSLNDVWVLSNANGLGGTPQWSQLSPVGGPPPARSSGSAVYDSATNRVIIFGGSCCATNFGGFEYSDVWVLTNANGLGGTPQWIQLSPTNSTSTRGQHTAVYDPGSNRMIVFGGQNPTNGSNDLLVLTNANGLGGPPQWITLSATNPPPARYNHIGVYDVVNNLMTIGFGAAPGLVNDVWVLTGANGLAGTPAWTQLNPGGTLPTPRENADGVYDPGSNRLIMFGGNSTTGVVQDVWVLTHANGVAVVLPPAISKSFGDAAVPINSATSLTFTITNPSANTVALTGVGFTDTLPPGLVVVSPTPGATSACGGTETIAAGSITLANATIAAGGNCILSVTVKGITGGTQNNITTNVTSNEGGPGSQAKASIVVVLPPVISKAFGTAVSVPVGASAALTITVENPNASTNLSEIAFTDPLPSGLVVANPNGVTGSCGGTVTALPGSGIITLSGGTLSSAASCTFSVAVLGVSEGVKNNLTSQVNSKEGGLGNTAAATLVVGDSYQVRYISNLNAGDSFVDLTDTGFNGGVDPAGDICANVYVFAADQQLVACCSCPLTPNHLKTLSGQSDLIHNALTPGVASAVTVGLLVTANPNGNATACNAASVTASQLTVGLRAYGTALHALPGGSYGVGETVFSPAGLSASELMKMTQFCAFIQNDGSRYGICGSCKEGAAGAKRQ